jgi:hypothetical protein
MPVKVPVTVTERSKAWAVFAYSEAGIVGSRHGCLVCGCVYSVCVVLCLGSGLATNSSLVQGVLSSVEMITKLKVEARAHGDCRASEKKNASGGTAPPLLISPLDGGEQPALQHPHCMWAWMGLRVSMDAMKRRKITSPARIKPKFSALTCSAWQHWLSYE